MFLAINEFIRIFCLLSSSLQNDQSRPDYQWPIQENFLDYLQSIEELTPIQDILNNDFSEELSYPVGCRLRQFAHRWRQLGASSYLVDKITNGIAPEWYSIHPPLTGCPGPQFASDTSNKKTAQLIEDMISDCLEKKSIQIVQQPGTSIPARTVGFSWFLRRTQGNLRPIIDLSYVNSFAITPHFKMETSNSIRDSLSEEILGDQHRSSRCLLSPSPQASL